MRSATGGGVFGDDTNRIAVRFRETVAQDGDSDEIEFDVSRGAERITIRVRVTGSTLSTASWEEMETALQRRFSGEPADLPLEVVHEAIKPLVLETASESGDLPGIRTDPTS